MRVCVCMCICAFFNAMLIVFMVFFFNSVLLLIAIFNVGHTFVCVCLRLSVLRLCIYLSVCPCLCLRVCVRARERAVALLCVRALVRVSQWLLSGGSCMLHQEKQTWICLVLSLLILSISMMFLPAKDRFSNNELLTKRAKLFRIVDVPQQLCPVYQSLTLCHEAYKTNTSNRPARYSEICMNRQLTW